MEEIVKSFDQSAKLSVESLKSELAGIRTNRPHPGLVEDIRVDYLGQQLSLKQLGSISIIPPREIDINVWDASALNLVVKAIETSGRGLTANISGNLIRINLPTMSDERRVELAKLVKSMTEQIKIKVRSLRDEANKKAEAAFKAKTLNEDQKFKTRERIQKSVDKVNADIENLLVGKLKEINE